MPRIVFAPPLHRLAPVPEVDSSAGTLRAALDEAFVHNPLLRGHVLDERGGLRANVIVYIDGRRCSDRRGLADVLHADSRVQVLQALSGG